ncbi:MAG: FUSC family protein [Oscillospiraceae bacterium]|nr:FUSC family protein [Oscillospiraceae bacterium]
MLHNRQLPMIGGRILKSSLAAVLCILVYELRTLLPIGNGIPFYSVLAALWCMQPYPDTTRRMAAQRSIGTLIGAAFGLLFILLGIRSQMIAYLTAGVIIIPVIYACVLLDKKNAAFFSCVVFLSISLSHSFDEAPYVFVLNRVLDTIIGILIGVTVNSFRLPEKHDRTTLYVCGIDSVLLTDHPYNVPYSKVELNRLIDGGVQFTVSTIHTLGEVIALMDGVHLKLPVIVMDGALLYQIAEQRCCAYEALAPDAAKRAEALISSRGVQCFVTVLLDETLLTYYGELSNDAERSYYEEHRRSPYCHFVRKQFRNAHSGEQILRLTVLAETEQTASMQKELTEQLGDTARVTCYPSPYPGYSYLKVMSAAATKQTMLRRLQEQTEIKKAVTFGSIPGAYDVLIDDGGGDATVKKLKKLSRMTKKS